jgi:hypothetical protein
MRTTFATVALAAAAASAAELPLSQRLADSAMSRQQGALPNVRYETGVFQRALEVCLPLQLYYMDDVINCSILRRACMQRPRTPSTVIITSSRSTP